MFVSAILALSAFILLKLWILAPKPWSKLIKSIDKVHNEILEFAEYYKSKLINLYLGTFLVFTVKDPKGIKEVMYNSSFEGRPKLFIAQMRHPQNKVKGIFFNTGHVLKEQKMFFARHLRDFGFGIRNASFEEAISEEIQDLINLLKNGPKYSYENEYIHGNEFLAPIIFQPFTTNIFFEILFGERLSRSEHYKFRQLSKNGVEFIRNLNEHAKILSIFPWIRFIFPDLSGYNRLIKANTFLFNYFKNRIECYLNNIENSEANKSKFLDIYIQELKKERLDDGFEMDQFIMTCLDFSLPPNTGIPFQMSMLFQWLLIHPNIQENVQEEIDSVVGRERLPTLDDRKFMPYTEACIREGTRIYTLLPTNIVHLAVEDSKLMGYNIPKNTTVIASLHDLHYDENIWDNPCEFNPERFLDCEGKLCLSKDKSLPYGAGKRSCPAEIFSRNLMFLLFSGLLQNISVESKEEHTFSHPRKDKLTGILKTPKEQWICYSTRK